MLRMNQKGKKLAIWGVTLQIVASVVIVIGIATGTARAIGGLGQAETQSSLASGVNIALYATTAGTILTLASIFFILIALFQARYRAVWFKKALWILSILWLFSFPIGTVLGIVILVYIIRYNSEFTEQIPIENTLKDTPN
jgi:hypothetical protein